MKNIVVLGAGGFAREVAWLIQDINRVNPAYKFLGYVISDLSRLSEYDSKDQVLGDLSWLAAHRSEVQAVAFGIGNPASKIRIATELNERCPWLEWPTLVHPSAQFDRTTSRAGKGVVICAGVIGTVNLTFEDYAMVNLSCTIGHESVLGRACVLNPTVNISGGVKLEEGVLVGTGAQILQYVTVGANATVGAGAVVNKNVAPGDTVVGIPAKSLKRAEQ